MVEASVIVLLLAVLLLAVGFVAACQFLQLSAQRETNRAITSLDEAFRLAHGLPPSQVPSPPKGVPFKAVFITLLLAPSLWGGSPQAAVASIHKDLENVPPQDRPYTRYLSAYHYHDDKERLELRQLADFTANSLSRNRNIRRVVAVDPVTDKTGKIIRHATLFRIDLRWYFMPVKVWEKLLDSEVYFHRDGVVDKVQPRGPPGSEKITVPGTEATPVEYEWKKVEWEGGDWTDKATGETKYYPKGAFTYMKQLPKVPDLVTKGGTEAVIPGTWYDSKLWAAIVKATHTEVPVVRADWFIVQVFQQDERDGSGYFDFLEIKNRADVEKLALLNRDQVEKALEEIRAIMPISNVALNNRQIARLGTARGGYWYTLDAIRQKKRKDNLRRNAQRNLDIPSDGIKNFIHDAEEIYFFLPNRLFGFFAGDAKGVLQASVPPNVASDKSTFVGNDTRIHPRNCVFCHKEGLRPLNDWARRVYRVNSVMKLVGPIDEKQEKLQSLYLSNLEDELKADQDRYAKALWAACELKPPEVADLLKKYHDKYLKDTLGVEDVARELGVTKAHLLASLKRYALFLQKTKGRGLDPALVGLLMVPEESMRREYFEEVFSQAMDVVMGVLFVGEPYKEVVGPPKPANPFLNSTSRLHQDGLLRLPPGNGFYFNWRFGHEKAVFDRVRLAGNSLHVAVAA